MATEAGTGWEEGVRGQDHGHSTTRDHPSTRECLRMPRETTRPKDPQGTAALGLETAPPLRARGGMAHSVDLQVIDAAEVQLTVPRGVF